MEVKEIIKNIENLSKNELKEFLKWVEDFENKIWDKEFENDVLSGKLDKIEKKVIEDYKKGKCQEI